MNSWPLGCCRSWAEAAPHYQEHRTRFPYIAYRERVLFMPGLFPLEDPNHAIGVAGRNVASLQGNRDGEGAGVMPVTSPSLRGSRCVSPPCAARAGWCSGRTSTCQSRDPTTMYVPSGVISKELWPVPWGPSGSGRSRVTEGESIRPRSLKGLTAGTDPPAFNRRGY